MGRDTGGVRGMNVSKKGNEVIAMAVAKDDADLLVVTEGGYGKRTSISEYPVKGRGTMGVLTIKLTDKKGELAGALIVRSGEELLFMSQNGMVQRTRVDEISQYKRAAQGVRLMNIKEDDCVSAVARVMESDAEVDDDLVADVDGAGAEQTELADEAVDGAEQSELIDEAVDDAEQSELSDEAVEEEL